MELTTRSVEIRPESNVYATYRRISYKIWYALGEFVDNSTQSFFAHREALLAVTDRREALTIDITYDPGKDKLTVVDNAFGMAFDDFQRAIQLNQPPADRTGRSEFGMGLKMAACWLGNRWQVVSKELGSEFEYSAVVDIDNLERNKPASIPVTVRSGCDPKLHYTRIEIEALYRKYRGRAIARIKEHLSSMYRNDLRSGEVIIHWNHEPLQWIDEPPFTERLPDGSSLRWEKDVSFEVEGYPVSGKVWMIIPGNARRAGMHLFRRGRLVLGGPGEGYKPEEIFQAPNSFQSQRLVGELNLDDWPVTQTKDAFDWSGDLEHAFINKLNDVCDDYVAKAKSTKSHDDSVAPTTADGQIAGDSTREALSDESLDEAIVIVEAGPPPEELPQEEEVRRIDELTRGEGDPTYVSVGSGGLPTLMVWWLDDQSPSDVYAEFSCPSDDIIHLAVNLNHPFVTSILRREPEKLALWAQMVYVDALVERGIRKRGSSVSASSYRVFRDQFLRRLRND